MGGNKLGKHVENSNSSQNTITDYIENMVYIDGHLGFFTTEEGRAIPVVENGQTHWEYEYNLKDHLGNNRVTFQPSPSGTPVVVQTSSYYPFGTVMAQQNPASSITNYEENKYLYNGKEVQNDKLGGVSLDWYDYGARFYDPALGRWHAVDPLAEKYYNISPYVYAANNPILFIDPNGMEVKNAHKKEREEKLQAEVNAMVEHEGAIELAGITNADGMSKKERKEAGIQDSYKNLKDAKKDFSSVDSKYQKVESLIADIMENDIDMYSDMDNLSYINGVGEMKELNIYISIGDLPSGTHGGTSSWAMRGSSISNNRSNITLKSSSSGLHLAHEFGHMESLSMNPVGYTNLVKAAGSGYDCQSNPTNPISKYSLEFQYRYKNAIKKK